LEDEEEGEEVVNQVLDEIGVDLGQSVSSRCSRALSIHMANEGIQLGETPQGLQSQKVQEGKVAQAVGGGGGAGDAGDDDLQARLDSLRR